MLQILSKRVNKPKCNTLCICKRRRTHSRLFDGSKRRWDVSAILQCTIAKMRLELETPCSRTSHGHRFAPGEGQVLQGYSKVAVQQCRCVYMCSSLDGGDGLLVLSLHRTHVGNKPGHRHRAREPFLHLKKGFHSGQAHACCRASHRVKFRQAGLIYPEQSRDSQEDHNQ